MALDVNQAAGDDDIQVVRDPQTGEITVIDPAAAAAGDPTEIGSEDDSVLGDEDHDANLVEAILDTPEGASYLATLADELIKQVERDDRSRLPWKKRLADGVRLMGVTGDRKGGASFKNSSKAVHPVLTEACVQFQARAINELWPPAGPVKAEVFGEETPDVQQRQKRVERYMNYQYTTDMPEAFWELDQMLLRLPLEGSTFKKQYFDASLMRTTSRFLTADDVIVSNRATDLASAPRVTVRIKERKNLFLINKKLGLYADVDIGSPRDLTESDGDDEIKEVVADSEGRDEDDETPGDDPATEEYTHYEIRCELDLKGYEDKKLDMIEHPVHGPMMAPVGGKTGIALPYIVTVNVDSSKILAIVRNWKKEDTEHRRKVMDLVHYKYLPGFGFYGYGLLHAIGSLSEAASGALRALLDSAQFANMQGGFKSKDIAFGTKGEITIGPGQWVDVEGTFDDIRKALMELPYKEPSETLFKLLGSLVEYAQRFASTTEAMVGDASNTGPVGTTVALIEQGSKVFSAIHKRIHHAQGEEFQQVAALNAEHIPEEGLTFDYGGGNNTITRADFDEKISIKPVSDPNIFSQTQRIALAQAIKQLAAGDKTGKLYDAYEVDKNLLEAMRAPNIDRFLKDPDVELPSMSLVYENMAMVQGKPVKAYLPQDHKAHMMGHELFFKSLPPELQQVLMPAFMSHKAEHVALLYFVQVQQLIGVPIPPPPDFSTAKDLSKAAEKVTMPPELENKLSQATVQAAVQANQMQQQAQQQEQGQAPDPAAAAAAAEQQRKDAAAAAEIKRKDALAAGENARKDKSHAFDLARQRAQTLQDQRLKDGETAAAIFRHHSTARAKSGAGPRPANAA